MTRTGMIRPAWTPATIALMIIGFMVFWPLGLAMLAYILWGDRLDEFKDNVNRATDRFTGCSWGRNGGRHARHRHNGHHGYHGRTGNVAFDEWRETEMARIEEERRKLDEMRAEFDGYMRDLRRARDQEEFNGFMSSRGRNNDRPSPPQSVDEA